MQRGQHQQNGHEANCMENLPLPILERILVTNKDAEDKQALRLTCKLFRQTVDGCMTFAHLRSCSSKSWDALITYLGRMRRVRGIILHNYHNYGATKNVLKYLPLTVTTLSFHGSTDLKELGRLPCLTALILGWHNERVMGFEYVRGLTRLECCSPVGPLAPLALSLKFLRTNNIQDIQDLGQLTNLETLHLYGNLPNDLFGNFGHLPLQHICLVLHSRHVVWASGTWESAPPTLRTLTLYEEFSSDCDSKYLVYLPSQITHLQLFQLRFTKMEGTSEKLVAANLSKLARFDWHVLTYDQWLEEDVTAGLCNITKLSCLQALGLLLRTPKSFLSYEQIVALVPELTSSDARGMKLTVAQNAHDLHIEGLCNDCCSPAWLRKSAWETPSNTA